MDGRLRATLADVASQLMRMEVLPPVVGLATMDRFSTKLSTRPNPVRPHR